MFFQYLLVIHMLWDLVLFLHSTTIGYQYPRIILLILTIRWTRRIIYNGTCFSKKNVLLVCCFSVINKVGALFYLLGTQHFLFEVIFKPFISTDKKRMPCCFRRLLPISHTFVLLRLLFLNPTVQSTKLYTIPTAYNLWDLLW